METEQWGSTGAHTLPTRLYPTDFRGPPSSPSVALTKLRPHFLKLAPPLALLRPYYQLLSEGPTLPDLAPPSFPTSPRTQGLQQQGAVQSKDERSQVLQAHHRHIAVDPDHLVGRQ